MYLVITICYIIARPIDVDNVAVGRAVRADLRPARVDAIISVGEILEAFDQHWEEADAPLQKNGLLRLALAGVRVQRYKLIAAQATLAFYPLVRLVFCRNGSDGCRSLSSDRSILLIHPACPIKHFITEYLDDTSRGT